jgi:antitoxin CcdA
MAEPEAAYNPQARKKSVKLSINCDLVEKARALHINLSQTLEISLLKLLQQKEREHWVKENEEAIAEYNQRVEKEGVFSDGLRKLQWPSLMFVLIPTFLNGKRGVV